MPALNQMLQEHNLLAKKHGKMVLKTWKQPKEKLQDRIDQLKRLAGDGKPVTAKKAEVKKTAAPAEAKKDDNMLTIVDVAAGLGMNPKVARAKLRRKGRKSNEGRWERVKRDSKDHKDLIDLLKAAPKKAQK